MNKKALVSDKPWDSKREKQLVQKRVMWGSLMVDNSEHWKEKTRVHGLEQKTVQMTVDESGPVTVRQSAIQRAQATEAHLDAAWERHLALKRAQRREQSMAQWMAHSWALQRG